MSKHNTPSVRILRALLVAAEEWADKIHPPPREILEARAYLQACEEPDGPEVYITRHAVEKFAARSAHGAGLKPWELRDNMRYLMAQGEHGTRSTVEHGEQPCIRAEGWLFVLAHDGSAVVTCFYNPSK